MRTPVAVALVIAASVCAAHAQSYPSRPITMIVPWAAGGAIGVGRTAKASNDGYTILLTPGGSAPEVRVRVNNLLVGTFLPTERLIVRGLAGNEQGHGRGRCSELPPVADQQLALRLVQHAAPGDGVHTHAEAEKAQDHLGFDEEHNVQRQLHQDHVVTLETRPANVEGAGEYTIRDLVRNALRMRPERIIIGGGVIGCEFASMLAAFSVKVTVVEMMNAAGTCLVLWLGASRVQAGHMSPGDLLMVEQAQCHGGLYFVLMGSLSPLDGIGPKDIHLDRLLQRVPPASLNGINPAILYTMAALGASLAQAMWPAALPILSLPCMLGVMCAWLVFPFAALAIDRVQEEAS